MKNTMTRAHQIRKEAAAKWDCEISEIVFSICLKMAWEESKNMNESHIYKTSKGATIKIERITTRKIPNTFGGNSEKAANDIEVSVNGKVFLLTSLVDRKGFTHGLLKIDDGMIPLDATARAIYDKYENIVKSNVASFVKTEKEYQDGRKKVIKAMGK